MGFGLANREGAVLRKFFGENSLFFRALGMDRTFFFLLLMI